MALINIRGDVGVHVPTASQLTGRESEVVRLLVRGFSTKQIAGALGVSFHTASTHLKHIYKKLGVHKRTELVAQVLTGGVGDNRLRSAANPFCGPTF